MARDAMTALFSLARTLATCAALLLAIALAAQAASAVTIDWVTVGSPENAADTRIMHCGPLSRSLCGAVATPYKIGKYEVTNTQYAEFLDKVAATDTNELWHPMPAGYGGITRNGSPGSYSYTVNSGFESKPVVLVSFWDAVRFANWLHNGQPTGAQSALTTEDGAYTLTPAAIAANSVVRNPTARVVLPSEDEWYKAAYYDPIAGLYYYYPTGTNAEIYCAAPWGDTGNSANCGDAANGPTNVGAYALSDSPSGTFDQGGNVYEWQEQIKLGSQRGLAGGSYESYVHGALAAFALNSIKPSFESGAVGFRVASVPEAQAAPCQVRTTGWAAASWAGVWNVTGLGVYETCVLLIYPDDLDPAATGRATTITGSMMCSRPPSPMPVSGSAVPGGGVTLSASRGDLFPLNMDGIKIAGTMFGNWSIGGNRGTFVAVRRLSRQGRIAIDPGHGVFTWNGVDLYQRDCYAPILNGGRVTQQPCPAPYVVVEDELTLKLSKSIRDELMLHGFSRVFLSRDTSADPWVEECSAKCVSLDSKVGQYTKWQTIMGAGTTQRKLWAENQSPDVLVSVHTNGASARTAHGTEAYYLGKGRKSAGSKLLGQAILDRLVSTGLKLRGAGLFGDQYVSNVYQSNEFPSVLTEVAFHSNTALAWDQFAIEDIDAYRLSEDAWWRDRFAVAIADGIERYLCRVGGGQP